MCPRDDTSNAFRVTILTRGACHLCDVVHRMALRLQAELPLEIQKMNIEREPMLVQRYGTRIPVVLIDGIERLAGTITEGDLRRAMKRARWRRPISRILSRPGYAPKRG